MIHMNRPPARAVRVAAGVVTALGLAAAPAASANAAPVTNAVTTKAAKNDLPPGFTRTGPGECDGLRRDARGQVYAHLNKPGNLDSRVPHWIVARDLLRNGVPASYAVKLTATFIGESADLCPGAYRANLNAAGAITSTDIGICQINTKYHPQYRSWNLWKHGIAVKACAQIWKRAGANDRALNRWHAWSVVKNDAYAMNTARAAVAKAKAMGY